MIDATRTTSTLLAALHEPDNARAWQELDERYRPILVNLARRAGLNEADAADAAQETMADFFRAYGQKRYDRSRGRLRQWLIGIARLKIADMQRLRARTPGALATGAGPVTEADWSAAWEAEQRAAVLRAALEELRGSAKLAPKTLEAFELVALRHMPPAEAAEQLGISTQEVYLAKSRCLERIRSLIERIQTAYEED